MEHLEIVHEDSGESTGVVMSRPQMIQEQAWCKSSNIYVMNSQGQILCHQRSFGKERWPGYWMTHLGGHVGADETYEVNAVKELEEEAGIKVDVSELIHWRTTRIPWAHLWTKEFLLLIDRDLSELPPQPGEVEQFAWKSPEEIITEFSNGVGWCAGTLDFWTEYHCLRAALTAAHSQSEKASSATAKSMEKWHKINVPYVPTFG